jgi:hypothetical protein
MPGLHEIGFATLLFRHYLVVWEMEHGKSLNHALSVHSGAWCWTVYAYQPSPLLGLSRTCIGLSSGAWCWTVHAYQLSPWLVGHGLGLVSQLLDHSTATFAWFVKDFDW